MVSNRKSPHLTVAVISDGKPGHENQSLGIAERLPGADILLLRHNFKESLSEAWLRFQVRLSTTPDKDRARQLLGRVYSDTKINKLVAHSPRAIIAAGTLSAAPCLLAGALTGARTCICMRPSFIPLSRFDLAVVPAHDNPPDTPNILRSLAAPNRVSPERLSTEAERWAPELPDSNEPVLAWVIGGPSASARFDESHVLSGLVATLEWASQNSWRVWLSTARRTPETLEAEIADLPKEHPALEWSLLWHRDQRNPLYAMFCRCRVAIVTSDSVSMIAEAASAGKGPLVYQATEKAGERKTKQDRMVDGLLGAGYGDRAATSEELAGKLDRIAEVDKVFPALDDTARAAERLTELLP